MKIYRIWEASQYVTYYHKLIINKENYVFIVPIKYLIGYER